MRTAIADQIWTFRHLTLRHWRERAWMTLAFALPKSLVLWAAVRLIAHATTGPRYGSTDATQLTAMDALKRWDD